MIKDRNWGTIIIVVLMLVIFTETVSPGNNPPFVDPNITSGEKSLYYVKENGKESKAFYIITHGNCNNEEVYIIRSESYEMIMERDTLRPISIKKTNSDGKIEFSIKYAENRVHFVYPGPKRNKVEKVPEDRYDMNIMIEAVRGFPFDRKDEVEFTLVTPEHIIGAYIKIADNEFITVPAGSFDCYKLEGGIAGFKGRIFRTKFYFWVEKEYPHRLIKYTDSEDERLLELVSYESTQN